MCYLCGNYNKKAYGYSSLIPFGFNLLTSAAAERSREKKHMRASKAPNAKRAEGHGTVTRCAASVRIAVKGRKRSLHASQRGAAREEKTMICFSVRD